VSVLAESALKTNPNPVDSFQSTLLSFKRNRIDVQKSILCQPSNLTAWAALAYYQSSCLSKRSTATPKETGNIVALLLYVSRSTTSMPSLSLWVKYTLAELLYIEGMSLNQLELDSGKPRIKKAVMMLDRLASQPAIAPLTKAHAVTLLGKCLFSLGLVDKSWAAFDTVPSSWFKTLALLPCFSQLADYSSIHRLCLECSYSKLASFQHLYYAVTHNSDKAMEAFKELVQWDEPNARLMQAFYFRKSNPTRAQRILGKEDWEKKNEWVVWAWSVLSAILKEKGEKEASIEALEKAIGLWDFLFKE
jgi:tetratricopeptide (TPR) repeat protein